MSSLEHKVWDCIRRYSLLAPGDRVLVAFSGGPDSVALTEVLLRFRKQIPLEVALFHLNHGLRGEEAERDEEFCRAFAQSKGLTIFVEKHDIEVVRRREGWSLEEAARAVRYHFLRTVAQRWGASKIALGHTLDDQVETMVMNFVRGTGLRGLAGMRVRSEIFIRPLLAVAKKDIVEFLCEEGIPFVEDSSNRDVSFLRNRIRWILLPLFEKLNPHYREALLRLSLNVQEELALRETDFDLPWEKTQSVSRLSLDFLHSLPETKRLLALRSFIEKIRGSLWDVTREHLKAINHIIEKRGGEAVLPGKWHIWIEEGYLYASPLFLPLTRIPPWSFEITLPGQNILREVGLLVEGDLESALPKRSGWSIILDLDKTIPPFHVRNFREGDRICRDGKVVKVKEIFEKCGLVWEWRRRIPLLCDREKILWIPGIALDESVRVQENSKRILRVVLKRYKR